MTVNNFDIIKPLLNFTSEDDFYFIQILKRRKENPDMKTGVAVIKEYFVDSLEYLDKKMDDMIEMATKHNARVTIRLNKRSYKKTAMKTLVDVAQKIEAGQFKAVKKSFSSAAGKYSADRDKTWILDIDQEDIEDYGLVADLIIDIKTALDSARPEGEKLVARIPSATGFHLIVRPFDVRVLNDRLALIEIKKDNPTNLYIP